MNFSRLMLHIDWNWTDNAIFGAWKYVFKTMTGLVLNISYLLCLMKLRVWNYSLYQIEPALEYLAHILPGFYLHVFPLEHLPFPSSPSRCSTPRTWWPPVILVTDVTSPSPLSSEDACPWRKWMNSSWTSRTRTAVTSLNGSPTTWRLPSATSLPED